MSKNRSAGGGKVVRFPWWASVLLAVVCYCTLKYLLPQFQPADPALARLVHAAPFFAPIVTIPLLLLAAKQLYDSATPDDEDPDKDKEDNNGDVS